MSRSMHGLPHVAQLTLTRLRAGELTAAEENGVSTHLAACPECAAKLEQAEDEAARFEVRVPFARFEAGVRGKLHQPSPLRRRLAWLLPALSLAVAGLAALVAVPPELLRTADPGANRVKGGGPELTLAIAAADGAQRAARAGTPEPLATGDRVRIGYSAGTYRFVLAASVDAAGEVTPLYPESGSSVPAAKGAGPHFLPGSLEFTGRGAEVVVLVLTEEPVRVEQVSTALREAYARAGGDVTRLPPLTVPGAQFHQVVLKP